MRFQLKFVEFRTVFGRESFTEVAQNMILYRSKLLNYRNRLIIEEEPKILFMNLRIVFMFKL